MFFCNWFNGSDCAFASNEVIGIALHDIDSITISNSSKHPTHEFKKLIHTV